MEAKVKTQSEVISELNGKLSTAIKAREAEIVRINALPQSAKGTAKYELMPGLTAEQLQTATPIINLQNMMKSSVLSGAVEAKLIRKVATAKVDNAEYAKYNALTTEIKAIAKQLQEVYLNNKPKKAGRTGSGTSEPITPEVRAKRIKAFFDAIPEGNRTKYGIELIAPDNPAKTTLKSVWGNSPYGIEIQRKMVSKGVAKTTTEALGVLRAVVK